LTQEQINQLFKKIILSLVVLMTLTFIIIYPSFRFTLIKAIRPIAIAFSIAYLVDPIVRLFSNKFKLTRKKSLVITLLLLLCTIFVMISLVLPNLLDSFNNLNTLLSAPVQNETTDGDVYSIEGIEKLLGIEITNEMLSDANKAFDSAMTELSSTLTAALQGIISSILAFTSSIVSFFLSFIIAIYMLLDKEDLLRRFKRMSKAFLSKEKHQYLTHIAQTTNDVFSSFFVGKIIDSAIIGVLCWGVMFLFKIPNATTFGFIVGLTNMIPYFGPIIGAVPCVIITLIIAPTKALWVLIIIIVLQQFDGLILGPKILGDKLGVGAFWIITAVTVGGAIWGVMGMLLGVPIVIIFKNLIEESVDRRLSIK